VATALGEEADVPAEAGGEEVAAAPLNPQDPKLVEAVKTAVAEEQRKRQEAMGERFAAMAKARESSLLDRLVEEHGVTPYQRGEMEKLLERRRQAIGEMFRTMFSGQEGGQPQDFMKIREKMGEIRQETDQEIQALLSAPQYEAFKAEDRMGGPGFMRGGGGGGRGR
jgi:ATP/maltotriose-dependent transcriptional regulator MalT